MKVRKTRTAKAESEKEGSTPCHGFLHGNRIPTCRLSRRAPTSGRLPVPWSWRVLWECRLNLNNDSTMARSDHSITVRRRRTKCSPLFHILNLSSVHDLTSTVKETRLGALGAGFLMPPSLFTPSTLHSDRHATFRRGPTVRRCEKSLPGWRNPTSSQ